MATSSVQAGFTVEVRRSEPPECERIREEIARLEAEIRALQEQLSTAPTGEKPGIRREIGRLQGRKTRLQEHGRNLGCRVP